MMRSWLTMLFMLACTVGCSRSMPPVPEAPSSSLYSEALESIRYKGDSVTAITMVGVRQASGGAYLDIAVEGPESLLVAQTIAGQLLWHGARGYIQAQQTEKIEFLVPRAKTSDYMTGFHLMPVYVTDDMFAPPHRMVTFNERCVVIQPIIVATQNLVTGDMIRISFVPEFWTKILADASKDEVRKLTVDINTSEHIFMPKPHR